ncbi:MAG TPA: hypothetical protein VK541_17035, partial [Pedobacter sp.]|nr:hypothetical protein [Pedobacter sp.]
ASNINGIPGLFVMGEYEWGDQRIAPAMNYVKANPKAPIAYLCDAGHGHFDFSDELVDFLCMFLSKVSKERLPKAGPLDKPVVLKAVDPAKGWRVDRWRKDEILKAPSAPYGIYSGAKDEAGWAFDKQMATATEKYYASARGKIRRGIAYAQDGSVLPASGFEGYKLKFNPLSDGLTFHVSALLRATSEKSPSVKISRICGPVIQVNDTTFKVSFYRMGMENKKRTNDIWLMATEPGDEKYKSSVQQANLKIPFRNTEGKDQKINFPDIPAQKAGIRSIKLRAVSDAPVPVSYYIKNGPAEIDGDVLVFTQIPPRAKFPVKVTVVAWQYGQSQVPKLKTAKAVERTFYINKT